MTPPWLDPRCALLPAAAALSVALGGPPRERFHGEPRAQPALVAAVAVAVTVTALLATWIPVRRATEVPPTVARRAG